jgi:hypothetical protein
VSLCIFSDLTKDFLPVFAILATNNSNGSRRLAFQLERKK